MPKLDKRIIALLDKAVKDAKLSNIDTPSMEHFVERINEESRKANDAYYQGNTELCATHLNEVMTITRSARIFNRYFGL